MSRRAVAMKSGPPFAHRPLNQPLDHFIRGVWVVDVIADSVAGLCARKPRPSECLHPRARHLGILNETLPLPRGGDCTLAVIHFV